MSIDLTTKYGGLRLKSPVVVSACPLSIQEQTRWAMQSAGAGAIVLPSLFEEQILDWNERNGYELTRHEKQLSKRLERTGRSESAGSAESYLTMIRGACERSAIPIIASMNGESGGNWLGFARQLEEAGAAAIELNVHHSPAREYTGPREMEDRVVELASAVGRAIKIPLFLKLGRDYTSLSHLSRRLLSGA